METHDNSGSQVVQPVSQEKSSLKADKTVSRKKNASKKVSCGQSDSKQQVDDMIRGDDLEELFDVANTRVRATEGLTGKPLDEEQIVFIVNDVLESRRKTKWCTIGGCTTDLQLLLGNANTFQNVVVLLTTLLLQRKKIVGGGNVENREFALEQTHRKTETPNLTRRHVLSMIPYSSEKGADKDARAQVSARPIDHSSAPSGEHVADEQSCNKENVDPVHGVEYTMEQLQVVLSNAIAAAHNNHDEESTNCSLPSTPDVSFEDHFLSVDMIFEKVLEFLPSGLGLDTSDLVESLPDEQEYESFAHDTSTLIDADTTFDTKDADTIDDGGVNNVRDYAELLSSLFLDANKLKEASLAALAAAETSFLGPLFRHDNPVTSIFSSGKTMSACDAREPECSSFDLHFDAPHCETWDAQLAENIHLPDIQNIPLPDIQSIPIGLIEEATKRLNFTEGCQGGDSRAAHAPSCSLTEMTDQFPSLLCNLDSFKSCDEQNDRRGNPDELILDPNAHQSEKTVEEPTKPSTVPQTVLLRSAAVKKRLKAPAQELERDNEIIRQGNHAVRVVQYRSEYIEELQPFDEMNAVPSFYTNTTSEQSSPAPELSSADEIQDMPSSRNEFESPNVKNAIPTPHQATTRSVISDLSDYGEYGSINIDSRNSNTVHALVDPVKQETVAQEHWTSFSNSPFDEFLNAPSRTTTQERVTEFNPFFLRRRAIPRSGAGKRTPTISNRKAKISDPPGNHHQNVTSSPSSEAGQNSAAVPKSTSSRIGSESWRSHRFFKPQHTTKAPSAGNPHVHTSDSRLEGEHANFNTTVGHRTVEKDPLGTTRRKPFAESVKRQARALRYHSVAPSIPAATRNAGGEQSAETYAPTIPWEFFHDNDHAPMSSSPTTADRHAVNKRRGRTKCMPGGEQSSPSSVGDFSKKIEVGYGFDAETSFPPF
jgi:hypothetical protein